MKTLTIEIPKHGITTNARINELIQEVEQILETQTRQIPDQLQFGPPRDSLIPPVHSTEALSLVRSDQREEQRPREIPETTFTKRVGDKVKEPPLSRPIRQIGSLRKKSETQ